MLSTATGELGMDYLGRFETLQCSFDEVCARIGLSPRTLRVRNATTHAPAEQVLDAELRAMVAAFYGDDFRRLGYEVPVCD